MQPMPALYAGEKAALETDAGCDRDLNNVQSLDAKPPACITQAAPVEPAELKSGSDKQPTTSACSDDRCDFSFRITTICGIVC